MTRRIGMCARCEHDRELQARGLCVVCYNTEQRAKRLEQWPLSRTRWSSADLLAEWEHLREAGYTRPQAAARLNVTDEALYQAIRRAAKAAT